MIVRERVWKNVSSIPAVSGAAASPQFHLFELGATSSDGRQRDRRYLLAGTRGSRMQTSVKFSYRLDLGVSLQML